MELTQALPVEKFKNAQNSKTYQYTVILAQIIEILLQHADSKVCDKVLLKVVLLVHQGGGGAKSVLASSIVQCFSIL